MNMLPRSRSLAITCLFVGLLSTSVLRAQQSASDNSVTTTPVVVTAGLNAAGLVRVPSGTIVGMAVSNPQPDYPPVAKAAHVQGTVVLQAIISKTGTIEGLAVISGPPMLRASALDAVRRWRYKPYIFNGVPTEVDTTISVNFTFGDSAAAQTGKADNQVEAMPTQLANISAISGRVPPDQVANVLKQLDDALDKPSPELLVAAAAVSTDLMQIEKLVRKWQILNTHPLLREFVETEKRFGPSFQPKSVEDVIQLNGLLERLGRFLSGQGPTDSLMVCEAVRRDLKAENSRREQIENAKQVIVQREALLDSGNLIQASEAYALLSNNSFAQQFPPTQQYLRLSQGLATTKVTPPARILVEVSIPGRLQPQRLEAILRMSEASYPALPPQLITMSQQLMQALVKQAQWAARPDVQMNRPGVQSNIPLITALEKRLHQRLAAQSLAEAKDIYNIYLQCDINEYGWIKTERTKPTDLGPRFERDVSAYDDAQADLVWGIKQAEADLDRGNLSDALVTYQALRIGSTAVRSIRGGSGNDDAFQLIASSYFDHFALDPANQSAHNIGFLAAYLEATASMYPALLVRGRQALGWDPSKWNGDIPGRATIDELREIFSELAQDTQTDPVRLSQAMDNIISIERALNDKELAKADDGLQALVSLGSTTRIPGAAHYLDTTRSLRDDLDAYIQACREDLPENASIAELVKVVVQKAALLQGSKDRPLTLSCLQKALIGDDAKLKHQIDAMQPLLIDANEFAVPARFKTTTAANSQEKQSLLESRIAVLDSRF